MISFSSYPSGRGFSCQEQDDFPATGTASVDSVGGSQKLNASNRMSLAVFSTNGIPEKSQHRCSRDCREMEQGAAGTLDLDMAKEPKGAQKNSWNTRLEPNPQIRVLKPLPSFLLVQHQYVAGTILPRRQFPGGCPRLPGSLSFSNCCWKPAPASPHPSPTHNHL